jgi:type IV secretion system protein VirD4
VVLDECANIAPLPKLPTLMSDGGGSGISTMMVLQSIGQGRKRWGKDAMDGLWEAARIKVVLGGGRKRRGP